MGELKLGEFEQATLLALMHCGGESYGMVVRRELSERTARNIAIGAVYSTLDRLETKGLVASRQGDPDPVRGGHPRRFYRITAAGKSALAHAQRVLERLWEGVELNAGK